MKKNLFLAALVAMFAISCQKDFNGPTNISVESEVAVNPYVVSVDQALARLDAEMAAIYGEGTRAASRVVKSVQTLNIESIAPATRGGDDFDATDLLYIVEFEDNQGSAILGADVRVDEVFAILDESVITEEDFENAAAGVENEELDTYLADLILDTALEQISTSSIVLPPSVTLRESYYEYETITETHNACYVKTKWGQGAPYNNLCYNNYGIKCAAGDTPIAVGQLLLQRKSLVDMNITIDGEQFSVPLLKLTEVNRTIDPGNVAAVNNEVAKYVVKLSNLLNVARTPTQSIGDPAEIVPMLRNNGYSNATIRYGNASALLGYVSDQICNYMKSVLFSGIDTANKRHTWIIDSYHYKKYNTYWCTKEGLILISREFIGVNEYTKVHCNFGWEGKCDGYYNFGIFNVSTALDGDDIVTDWGDVAGTEDSRNFTSGFALITL